MPDNNDKTAADPAALFAVFNEIGIINQLASSLFQRRLEGGVTIAQFSVLNHLIRVEDGQTPLQLASAFQTPKTSMTHSIAELERRWFVATKVNPKDKRSKCVWLTDAGRAFRDNAVRALAPDFERLGGRIDAQTLGQILPHLIEVRTILDQDRDE